MDEYEILAGLLITIEEVLTDNLKKKVLMKQPAA